MTNPTAEKRREYQGKVQAELDKINARINEYKAKAEYAKADAISEYHSQLESLMAKRDAAVSKLEQMQSASAEAWEELQRGFENAWKELDTAMQGATAKFEQFFN
jgi:chromosome segregation ATPase